MFQSYIHNQNWTIQRFGVFKLEQMSNETVFERIGKNKEMSKVELKLPKFKIESEISLVRPLKELGIKKLFGGDAQLRGISEKPLKVNDAIQKAFIEVDEAGSEASSTRPLSQTGKKVSLRKGTRAIPFVVDHPFLFYVRDLQTGLLLFQGRFVEPPSVPEIVDDSHLID